VNPDPTERPTAADSVEGELGDPVHFEAPSDPFQSDPALEALRDDARVRGEKSDATRAFWKELPLLIIVALVVAVVIKTFLVQAFFIPSASMHDTLLEGDRVMVNKLAFRFGEPGHGDVIVFDSPLEESSDGENIFGAILRNIGESLGLSTPDTALIKRVIALEGDTIEIRDNAVFINGTAIDESYLTRNVRMPDFGPLEIPPDHVFVMGDNRNQSEDSRRFGPIPESSIIGRAFVRVWPPSRWGGI
jgi:signal peptidase I